MKMTTDLIKDKNSIKTDALNLYRMGIRARTEKFDQYFRDKYTFDYEEFSCLGMFFTDEQQAIYNEYVLAIAEELHKLILNGYSVQKKYELVIRRPNGKEEVIHKNLTEERAIEYSCGIDNTYYREQEA